MNIGIDLGGSHIGVGIVNNEGNIISKKDINIYIEEVEDIKKFIIQTIMNSINSLLDENKIILENIELIGIGTPGEPQDGIIKRIVNLGIRDFNIVEELKKGLQFDNIIIRNDGKCAGVAEKLYGSMKPYEDSVFLCLGTGIGGAAFLNNKLLKPKKRSGFEFGHMIIEKNGNLCKCGSRGCFETYCSMKRLKEKIKKEIILDNMESRDLLKYVKENIENEKIQEIIKEYIDDLVIGLSNITNLLEPECITIRWRFCTF